MLFLLSSSVFLNECQCLVFPGVQVMSPVCALSIFPVPFVAVLPLTSLSTIRRVSPFELDTFRADHVSRPNDPIPQSEFKRIDLELEAAERHRIALHRKRRVKTSGVNPIKAFVIKSAKTWTSILNTRERVRAKHPHRRPGRRYNDLRLRCVWIGPQLGRSTVRCERCNQLPRCPRRGGSLPLAATS